MTTTAPTKPVRTRKGKSRRKIENHKPGKPPQRSEREYRQSLGIDWTVVGWLGLLHVGALAAPFFFTWQGLVLALALHWLTGSVGICLTYHRLLTHSSFQTYRPVRWLLAAIGCLAGEGPPINWVADHRQHHANSDQPGDPHSPHDGAWWSHAFWLGWALNGNRRAEQVGRWAPDMQRDAGMRWLNWLFIPLNIGLGVVLGLCGWLIGGAALAASFVVWGMFVRLVFVLHATWLVNSASHMWGYRNYETTDDSRNNWWVAIITYGEGWHNNHHAYPRMANHGHKWWEIDATFGLIRLMRSVGLAWNVVDYKSKAAKQESIVVRTEHDAA